MDFPRYKKSVLFIVLLMLFSPFLQAQIKIDEQELTKKFPSLSLVFNRIFNSSELDSFYQKLFLLKKNKKGFVRIVHIGDSHIESGHLTGVVRNRLQDYFGNGGKPAAISSDLSFLASSFFLPEKDSSGVLYHSIGINGARYDSYTKSVSFWERLAGLQADLFIVSLGTNEAQGNEINENDFHAQVNLMIEKLKKASPGAAILISTTADSFKNGRPNRELWSLNVSLFTYCSSNNIPVWDLYRTSNGFGSAYNWIKKGMMDPDGVHFRSKAYEIQGQLLFNAIAKGYNAYVSSYR